MVLTAEQAKATDRLLRERFGISTLVLMENAGRSVAEEALGMLKGDKPTAVICGKGNNGGDGFVAARHLMARGVKPDILLAGKSADVRNEARANLDILAAMGVRVTEIDEKDLPLLKARISSCGLIIDALLGVGLTGTVKGPFKVLIEAINGSGAPVLAVDIPSGLDATTGLILGACVRARKTVTFIAPKRGMTVAEGPGLCGEIAVRGLGVPTETLERFL
ncbi:MAG: NAD(P)H-hydrate epimerase [Candidatus Omnitrophica bacterium]|nr:NAD(P)H-hydrate epimerase [Candidatus Omnitrophota bacterium]